jgi:ubiquinone/menaquinone biosynthesis C-methylase UbiE
MQNSNFSEFENEIIKKYTIFNKDIDLFFDVNQVIFLNDGYVPLDTYDYPVPLDINLSKKYQQWRYQVSMYKKLLDEADVYPNCNGTLLDISCGLGGGVSFYRDYYNFNKIVGIDINPLHIDTCKKRYKKVDFINASALRVPLGDKSVDVITSVEAASYYEDMSMFLEEAWRLLVPGGKLVISDRNSKHMYPYYKNSLFKTISFEDITKNVRTSAAISKYAIQKIDPHKVITDHIDEDESLYKDTNIIYYILVLQK